MGWQRALKEAVRSGLRIERKRLEPLVALRGAAGLALVIAASLWLFVQGGVVRRGAGLVLDTLEDLTEALGTAVPPMAVDTRARKPGS